VYSKEEKKQLTENFWAGFTLYCSRMPFLRGRRRTWVLHQTKVPNVHLKFEPDRNGVKVVLEIQHRNEEKRLEMFEKLEQYKVILEEGFENGLVWDFAFERETGQQVCRIFTMLSGVDINRQVQWEEMYTFMAQNMYKLETNFLELRELITE